MDHVSDLTQATATELLELYRTGTASPVEAVRAVLSRLEVVDPTINAFCLVDADAALVAAEASAVRWRTGTPCGPLDGVPTSIKDLVLTAGWPTRRGSCTVDPDQPWTVDAPATARLREAGAVLIGKTTTPEFGWKGVTDSIRHGATGNPWNPQRTSGGSSGGSAAAVSLGMGAWSVGTDGGGSVRIPAAFTGTVALKPTYGLLPIYPPSPFGTLSHGGPMTRTVTDAAAMLDVLTGFDARDWSALPTPQASFLDRLDYGVEGLRVAFSADLGYVRNDPQVDRLVRDAVGVLAAAGAIVEEVDPGFTDPIGAFEMLWFTGAGLVLQAYGEGAIDEIDPGLRRRIEEYADATARDFLEANAVRMDLGQRMGRFHQTYDLLLTPTMPLTAFAIGQDAPDGWPADRWTSWTPYTYPFNMTQQPALTVPCGLTDEGLPAGLQIIGPRHADALVLRAGRAYEASTGWHNLVPPGSGEGDPS